VGLQGLAATLFGHQRLRRVRSCKAPWGRLTTCSRLVIGLDWGTKPVRSIANHPQHNIPPRQDADRKKARRDRTGRHFPKPPNPLTTYSPNRINTLTLQPSARLLYPHQESFPTMPTPAEYAANRLNQIESEAGRHARSAHAASEPRDAETAANTSGRQGRARSSMNALRHGLTARVVVLPSDDMAAYKAFSQEIVDSLDPQTPVERQFAQTVADNQWRINRIRSIEDGMLGMGHFEDAGNFDADHPEIHSAMTAARAFRENSKAFVNLSIYEQGLTGPLYGGLSAAPVPERVSPPAQRAPGRAARTLQG